MSDRPTPTDQTERMTVPAGAAGGPQVHVPPPEELDLTESGPAPDDPRPDPASAPGNQARRAVPMDAVAWIGVGAVLAMLLAASFTEDGANNWTRWPLWAAFSVVAAATTLTPTFRHVLGLDATGAWRVAAAGAAGLVAYWVLLVAPWIERNVSFLATLGCAAGVYVAWRAPGRPGEPDRAAGRSAGTVSR